MLSHHLVQAVEYGRAAGKDVAAIVPRAVRALRDAGDRSWSLGAPAAALELYERSRALDPEAAADPYLLLRLGRALTIVRARGEEELARAAEALGESDPATAAEAELLRGEIVWQRGDQDGSFQRFDRAAAMVAELEPSRQKLFVVSQVARFLALAGHPREGLELAEDAIEMAEKLGDGELLADSLNTRGVARVMTGDGRWQEDLEQALALALEVKTWRAGRGYINLASTLMMETADVARAEVLMRKGLEFAEGLGIDLATRWSRSNLAEALLHLGRWDDALAYIDQEIVNPEPHYMQATCRRCRALLRVERGDAPGALEDIDAGLVQSRAIRDPQDLVPALGSRAFCLLRLGDDDGARSSLDELDGLQRGSEQMEAFGPSAVLLAHVAVRLGRDLELAEEGVKPTPWHEVATAILAGDLAGAADQLQALELKTLEALTRLEAARVLRMARQTAEAEAQLTRALAFYRSVGATAAIREGEALLAEAS
jgi:tetratricopeptide (TPR) repeat protein